MIDVRLLYTLLLLLPFFINENYMMALGRSKTHYFLGAKVKYNTMQMFSDTEHR